MKIDYCDEYDNAIIRVTKSELGLIIGCSFGDGYGNMGLRFSSSLIGKVFDLEKLKDTKQSIQIAHELKKRVAIDLRYMADEIEKKINFSIPELKD